MGVVPRARIEECPVRPGDDLRALCFCVDELVHEGNVRSEPLEVDIDIRFSWGIVFCSSPSKTEPFEKPRQEGAFFLSPPVGGSKCEECRRELSDRVACLFVKMAPIGHLRGDLDFQFANPIDCCLSGVLAPPGRSNVD